jgi:outer membrane protein OmpA-like peptidoglycan-associated protein
MRYRRLMSLARTFLAALAGAACLAAAPAWGCAPVTIYFGWNSAEVSAESREALERLALSLAWKGPDLDYVLLTAHTDSSGSAAANQAMARRRAMAVRAILTEQSIPADLIEIRTPGAERPRVRTSVNIREPRNRRVELLLQMSAEAQARQLEEGQPIC